jgi:hypothetical protein
MDMKAYDHMSSLPNSLFEMPSESLETTTVNLGRPRNGLRISKGNYKSGAWLPDMLSFILYVMQDIIKMFTVAP